MGHGIVLKGIVKYYGRGKNIPHTFGYTGLMYKLMLHARLCMLVLVSVFPIPHVHTLLQTCPVYRTFYGQKA